MLAHVAGLVLLLIVAGCAAAPTYPKIKTFFCQYYSTGSTLCYPGYRVINRVEDLLANRDRLDGSYGILGVGKPVKGSWDEHDGFALWGTPNATAPRSYLGTCLFDPAGWVCSGRARVIDNGKGGLIRLGGAEVRGKYYQRAPLADTHGDRRQKGAIGSPSLVPIDPVFGVDDIDH
ncbi:hypothetical protein BV898_18300 [Hypsibius exemplaris]|uniref:Uncharacterized protein n=1 Tax=Hypsibius exemplaris TaxID=2072580 RepID=A0A9X6NJI8_HYPEX|nr:hypothetical protein BV898_18300 [Hypsibius exemplaris]